MAKAKFPKTLYVTRGQDGNTVFYDGSKDLNEIPEAHDGEEIALYQFLTTRHFLVLKDAK